MDPIANMLTTLVNGQRAGKQRVALPYSRYKESLLTLLKAKGRIGSVRVQEGVKPKLIVALAYAEHRPALTGGRRLSKPGRRQYADSARLPYPKHGGGFYIVSTSQGLMDESKARREGMGGELVCEIW